MSLRSIFGRIITDHGGVNVPDVVEFAHFSLFRQPGTYCIFPSKAIAAFDSWLRLFEHVLRRAASRAL
jgi:hypothetical protein